MTGSFIYPIEKALNRVLETVWVGDIDHIKQQVKLRPPKNSAWGDLCTNVLLLAGMENNGDRAALAESFITAFESLDMIRQATLSETGYINIQIDPVYWGNQLPMILSEGVSFGLSSLDVPSDIVIEKPKTDDDLVSLRHLWNAEALSMLAQKANVQVSYENWSVTQTKGFPSAPAIAKCTAPTLRLALLSNSDDFAIHFSPMMAVDKAYSNPAFCILYAQARLASLLKDANMKEERDHEDMILDEQIEDISFSRPLERKIAKFLCDWPLVIEQSIKNLEMVHLTTFLHDLSLLFFQLQDQERVQSSDYLYVSDHKTARKLLLQTVDTILCGGLEILGIDIVGEFI